MHTPTPDTSTAIRDTCTRDMDTRGMADIVAITDTDTTAGADDMSDTMGMRAGTVGTDTGTGS